MNDWFIFCARLQSASAHQQEIHSSDPKTGWDRGFSPPGAFKLDHLQFIKPLLFWKVSIFFTFILGGQFLLPQCTNNGKRGIHPTLKVDEAECFHCLGHSNWTICSPFSPFCSENFPPFSPSYWGANSYYPRGSIMGKGNSPNPKSGQDRGLSMHGTFKLDHLHPFKPLLFP